MYIHLSSIYLSRLPAEERQLPTTVNPMCEVFPKGTKELSSCHKLKFSYPYIVAT